MSSHDSMTDYLWEAPSIFYKIDEGRYFCLSEEGWKPVKMLSFSQLIDAICIDADTAAEWMARQRPAAWAAMGGHL